MKKNFLGSRNTVTTDPRHIGDILHDFVNNSNSPLAKNYRKFLAANKSNAEKGDNKHE